MKISATRTFHRACNSRRYSESDKRRCLAAVDQFSRSPAHPGLNFERLGTSPRHNHCSIRASRELRVIVAVGKGDRFDAPESVTLANFGHHDEMYDWSRRQDFHTSDNDTFPLPRPGPSGQENFEETIQKSMSFKEWQLFLHPEQKHLVERSFPGEARMKGGAGTGKTVIAIHRAVRLGHRFDPERVLFTTFSKSLTEHARELLSRMPDAPANIDVKSIYQLVWMLTEFDIDSRAVTASFTKAYDRVVPGTSLEKFEPRYLRQEIELMLKGRNASRERYLDTDRFQRTGRKIGLKRQERSVCWQLNEAWNEEMRLAGTIGYGDALNRAVSVASRQDNPRWRAIIVDEAQDLTTAGMLLLRALVAGGRDNPVPEDGLLFLDDAHQRLDPGAYLPVWAGLDFSGRTVELKTGYRTTRQITEVANRVSEASAALPVGLGDASAPVETFAVADGPKPVFVHCGAKDELPTARRIIEHLVDRDGIATGEIGMFFASNTYVDAAVEWLKRHDIPCARLTTLRARRLSERGVRVGTFDRCKGMEFRVVLILRLGGSNFPFYPGETRGSPLDSHVSSDVRHDGHTDMERMGEEGRAISLNRLYVGMTRAKERVFLIADEAPCDEIQQAYDLFDWHAPSRPLRAEDIALTDDSPVPSRSATPGLNGQPDAR